MTQHQGALALNASPESTFNFETHAVRIVMRDGQPWFVATDVCAALGLSNPSKSVSALDDDERSNLKLDRGGSLAIISESGMYTLVLRCRDAVKPGTVPHRFRKWVTAEVLPAIRKTGSYGNPSIDVRDLLLSGQSDLTVPLPPHITNAINQQAWVLAGEAYGLIREHLERRVAFEAVNIHGKVNEKTALRAIQCGNLNEALARHHASNLRFLLSHAGCLLRITQGFVDEIREAQHPASNPAPQP